MSVLLLSFPGFLIETRLVPPRVTHLSHCLWSVVLLPSSSANHIHLQNTVTARLYFPRELHGLPPLCPMLGHYSFDYLMWNLPLCPEKLIKLNSPLT